MQLRSPVRLLGIDLGVTKDHTAVVVDGGGIVAPAVAPAPRSPASPRFSRECELPWVWTLLANSSLVVGVASFGP